MRRATYFSTGAIPAIVVGGVLASAYSVHGAIIATRGGAGGSIGGGGCNSWVGRTIGVRVGTRGGLEMFIGGSGGGDATVGVFVTAIGDIATALDVSLSSLKKGGALIARSPR
eukprot:3549534-Ditylum_brightwellii.AAC.1